MNLVTYRIYLTAQISILLPAAKLNTGELRLWLFDADNNLIALVQWSDIVGFTVEGSAQGQIITDKIPIEMGKVAEGELGLQGVLHLQSLRRYVEPTPDSELGL